MMVRHLLASSRGLLVCQGGLCCIELTSYGEQTHNSKTGRCMSFQLPGETEKNHKIFCDNATLIHMVCFWTLSIVLFSFKTSDQSTQLGHLESVITAEVKRLQLCPE
jgi:hypothetical protein